MPSLRIPKPSLGFVKRLLSQKTDKKTASDSATEVVSSKSKGKKAELLLEECPICHDPVGIPNPEGTLESWVTLHCQHKFGTNCIQAWLEESIENDMHSSPTCPMCRTTAKHACGHPVATPLSAHFTVWLPHPNPATPPPRRARVRRRLSRSHRAGQVHQAAQPNPRPQVQIVGQCTICKAAAAQAEKSMKAVTTPQPTPTAEPETSTSSRRAGIKSMIFTRSRRQNSGEPITYTPVMAPNPPTLAIPNPENTFLPLSSAIQTAVPHRNYYPGGNPCRVPQMPVALPRVATPTPETRRSSF